ncbi:MAG: rhomboid family intramembrane serine protease [Micrococcaceae bacterium]
MQETSPQSIPENTLDAPVCYRHPDHVSYVSCQRCGQHICPQCQTSSSVGVLCPDDAKATSKAPISKTVFGGSFRQGPPLVTYTIIALCVLVFIGEHIPSLKLVELWTLVPALAQSQPWRMITSIFLHDPSNIFHIGLNMYMLYIIGKALEPMLGRTRFAITFLLSGLGGSVAVVLLASGQAWITSTLGASGALFGLFGTLLLVQKKLGIDVQQIVLLIVINLAFGFMVSGVSWQAHVGGLIVGMTLGAIVAYAPRDKQAMYQIIGAIAVLLVLMLATYLKIRNGITV